MALTSKVVSRGSKRSVRHAHDQAATKDTLRLGIVDHRHVAMVGYSVIVRMAHATFARDTTDINAMKTLAW